MTKSQCLVGLLAFFEDTEGRGEVQICRHSPTEWYVALETRDKFKAAGYAESLEAAAEFPLRMFAAWRKRQLSGGR